MKYYSGEKVRLYDKVEHFEGGTWVAATVVFVSGTKEASDECMWLLVEKPQWAEGQVAIRWDDLELSIESQSVINRSEETVDTSILFADTEENDELRFIARKS